MTNQTSQGFGEAASPTCYVLLSPSTFKERLDQLQRGGPISDWLMDPLVTTSADLREEGYPAFQLDERLDHALLLKLRELYRLHQVADVFVWDFLRTRHKPLGGLTGVDFLLGFFTPAVAAMVLGEREEHFLDLALEEIGRLQQ